MTTQTQTADRAPPQKTPRPDHVLQTQQVSVLSRPGLASVLIPCCGQLEYTKLCVGSLLKHTRQPFELLFLDIGSLDGTGAYLDGIATAAPVMIKTVRTPTDLGIGQAVQDAIKEARGQYLVLLNNDCIVTDGWLNQLVGLAKLSPAMGLVGPMSNYAAPPQLVETVTYRIGPAKGKGLGARGEDWLVDVSAVEEFARKWREQERGKWVEVQRLGGFCLLVKRSVLDRIGPRQQWSELGVFDSDDLCAKARQAGFTLACCRDLYVHHFGTKTFAHGAPKAEVGN